MENLGKGGGVPYNTTLVLGPGACVLGPGALGEEGWELVTPGAGSAVADIMAPRIYLVLYSFE